MTIRHLRSGAGAAVAALLVLLPAAPAAYAVEEAGTTELTLFNINDFHGRITPEIGMGLAATLQQQRAAHPNSLFLSAGDNVSASLFVSSVQDDEPTLDYLNALGLQASAAGNHEFDKGLADLTGRISEHADFPILGANVVDPATGDPVLKPYTILQTDGGVSVAVIGSVTAETPQLVDPSALGGMEFTDPVAATNRYAEQLSDGDPDNGEADVIVAEYHEGVRTDDPQDRIVTQTSPAVDVIFTGHTHEEYVLPPGGQTGPGQRPVLQTGNYGDNLGAVTLTLDARHEVRGARAELIANPKKIPDAETIAADPVLQQAQRVLTDAKEYADRIGSRKLADLAAPVTTGWDPDKAEAKGGFDQRDRESTMGHLVADMYLHAAKGTGRTPADLAIINPGGLRDEFPAGLRSDPSTTADQITVADAVSVLPFANNLWTTQLTGAQLRQVLEEQWQQDNTGSMATRPYLQLGLSSNVTYTYTGELGAAGYATRGGNIDEVRIDGKPLEEGRTYTVALPSFLLGGGDNFSTLAQGKNAKDTAVVDSDAFQDYLRELGVVTPRPEKQAVRVSEKQEAYDLSGMYTVRVSDLAVASPGIPTPERLSVRIGGRDAGEVPVRDGAAEVSVPLSGLGLDAGTHEVELTEPTTGTHVVMNAAFTGAGAEPTPEPSPAPTGEPTPGPTGEPTPGPTSEPTTAPTPEPTSAPTSDPTATAGPGLPVPDPSAAEPQPGTGADGGRGSTADGALSVERNGVAADSAETGPGGLARTGAQDPVRMVLAGLLVLGTGAALVLIRPRRTR